MADITTQEKTLQIENLFVDGDTRTITLRNPKANITTEQIQDLNTLIQANNILLGDKTSATFGRIQSVKRITRTKTQIEI